MKLIRAHLPRQQSVVVFIVLLCLWSAVSSAPVTGQAQGARHTDRLLQLINRTLLQFPEGEKLLTIIIESNEASGKIRNIVSAGGARLRYQSGPRYEIEVRTDRARELLARLPAETIARLSWPHEAVATTSQGVASTGAGDMHLSGNDGAGIKIGVIDLGLVVWQAPSQAVTCQVVRLSRTTPTQERAGRTTGQTLPKSCTTWRPVLSFFSQKSIQMWNWKRRSAI